MNCVRYLHKNVKFLYYPPFLRKSNCEFFYACAPDPFVPKGASFSNRRPIRSAAIFEKPAILQYFLQTKHLEIMIITFDNCGDGTLLSVVTACMELSRLERIVELGIEVPDKNLDWPLMELL